ncbi:MAG: sulfatase [Planctomycetaceae bacterium]|nr:sulfatase [Planctomycetales bacterium]MCB9926693.1 sulfatase [Planctomycetaceae bacterium]
MDTRCCRAALFFLLLCLVGTVRSADRPNILIAVSDDQSYPHASAYGYEAIDTPAFDRVAKAGLLFRNAFSPAPGCSPMRAATLTGRNIWQIEHAGTHASSFSTKYEVYQDRLEASGYFVGYTGKGWGPGNWKVSGRTRNPAGNDFSNKKMESPQGISNNDYAGNFAEFLKQRTKGQPFSFWYGATEPHRSFKQGIGREHGLDPAKVIVPSFLPDTLEVRDDILDYCFEIQWFDQHLGRMLDELDAAGELDNTLVIVTSDNGMAFPRAKANCYEFGIHMPLAVAWPAFASGGRTVDDLVNLIDITATIYDVAQVDPPSETPIAGHSIRNILASTKDGIVDPERDAVYSGRERHSSSRFNSLSYPQRCIRTQDFLYIYNFRPERWPAGAPQKLGDGKYANPAEVAEGNLGPMHGGYHDIDACPSLSFLIERRDDAKMGRFLSLAVDKRPAEELFDIRTDPSCLHNLASNRNHAAVRQELHDRLFDYLRQTNDSRLTAPDGGDIWETYPRYSSLRWFPTPDWAKENPERVPKQDWLEAKRPK